MTSVKCRLCSMEVQDVDWILEGMPRSAQGFFLPDSAGVDSQLSLEIFQCHACGLVQLKNDPVAYFKEVIRATAFSEEMSKYRASQFRDFIDEFDLLGKTAIEIGCGEGEYLTLLESQGLKMQGLEYSHKSVSACQARGLNVSHGFINGDDVPGLSGNYAACFMFNFLEHLPQPISVLTAIASKLDEQGVGLIEVPNFEMIQQQAMFTEFCSDHLLYFTTDTFFQILSRSGMEVLEINPIWGDYILSAKIRKRENFQTSKFEFAREDLSRSIENFLRGFSPKSVAIWGAGHQALAVMAACKLGDKIPYVIDSATFKQNRMTPATHLMVFGPEILDRNPPEAILVMAAAFSDEIISNIKLKYGDRFTLAVLRGQEIFLTP